MNRLDLRVVLTLAAGESAVTRREFVWGQPVAPFSVGASADWSIAAPGVADTHLFLAFDGHRLHAVAVSPAHSVVVSGSEIGGEWAHVEAPARLVFGAASLVVDCEESPAVARAPIEPRPIVDLARPDQMPTRLLDLSQTLQLRTVRLEIPESMLAELRQATAPEEAPEREAHDVPESAPKPKPDNPAPSRQSGDTLIYQPVPVATLAFPVPAGLASAPRPADLANTLYDNGALRERAAQLAEAKQAEELVPTAQSVPAPEASPRPTLLRRPLAALRASSLPKQLTFALLPFAVAGVWAMQDGSASASSVPPPSHPFVHAAAASVRAPAPSAVESTPSAEPSAASAPSSLAEVPDQSAEPGERLALVAAFSGNKAEAAAIYERLAVAHHSRKFALAARLIREDHVRIP